MPKIRQIEEKRIRKTRILDESLGAVVRTKAGGASHEEAYTAQAQVLENYVERRQRHRKI